MFDDMAVSSADVLDPPWDCDDTDWRAGYREYTADEPVYSPADAMPSGWLALEIDAATADDGTHLDDTELIDATIALEHLAAWVGARQARLLAEFARRRPGDDPILIGSDKPSSMSRYAPDEVALALSQSRYAAKARIGQSVQLTMTLTDTLAAWETGRIDGCKVRAICDTTHVLDAATAVAVQDRVLARAPAQSLAQLKASLKRAVIAADPDGAAARHQGARRDRRVCVGPENDGMASIWALLPAHVATASHQWLTRLARGLGSHDPRGMDARRADLMGGLLTGNLTVLPDTVLPDTVLPDTVLPDTATTTTVTATSCHTDTCSGCDTNTGADTATSAGTGSSSDTSSGCNTSACTSPDTGWATATGSGTGTGSDTGAGSGTGSGSGSVDAPAAGSAQAGAAQGPASGTDSAAPTPTPATPTPATPTPATPTPATPTPATPTPATPAAPTPTAPTPTPTPATPTAPTPAGSVLRPVTPGKPLVQVVMPYTTLRGVDEQPCELVGYGPIPASLAREIAADAVWTRLVTDPRSGALLDHGRTTYRPPAALADFVKARDGYCRFPVCRRRAADCELDHTVPFPDGPTAEHNLYDGCSQHHHLKHDAGWTVTQHADGRITWETPTGHRYTSDPHDYRPEPDPPPRATPPAASPRPPAPAASSPSRLVDPWGPITEPALDPDPPPF